MILLPRIREAAQKRGLRVILLSALCLYVPAKAVAAQVLLERAFTRSLADQRARRPWPWADMTPLARLSVQRLGVTRMVLDSGSGQALAFGPTLLPGGAAPGQPGTTIIAAHRDTHFRFLRELHQGDVVTLETRAGLKRRYRVTGTDVVRWDRYAVPDSASGERLDLTTCFPFDAIRRGPWRYVVHAQVIA